MSALDRFNVHRCPTRRVFSGTGIELMTRQATIRYLYHSATAAISYGEKQLRPLYRGSTRIFEICDLEVSLPMSYDNRGEKF
ncbi:hypothetical protein TNCV_3496711 [Trichonephila clavipes]|nr:hypothetical protein TNCV_3496711 [Trichonephila clavipes]